MLRFCLPAGVAFVFASVAALIPPQRLPSQLRTHSKLMGSRFTIWSKGAASRLS